MSDRSDSRLPLQDRPPREGPVPHPSDPCPDCTAAPWQPHDDDCPWLAWLWFLENREALGA